MRTYAIIITILFLISAIAAFSLWRQSSGFMQKNKEQQVTIDSLLSVKTRLETTLDSLKTAFADLKTENETLEGRTSVTSDLIAMKEASLKKLKAQSSRTIQELRLQIEALQKTKTEYETVIAVLRAENEQLKAENAALKAENTTLKGEKDQLAVQVDDLAKKLEEQIRRTQSATFKASSFRVEVARRGDKLTARAKKARELNISFDLADVPKPYQGIQKLYLSITDANGKPISTANPTNVTVHAPSGDVPVIALQTRPVNLASTQRLSFNYKLEEKLAAGNYVAAIYCDKGLLGASSFRLTK
ncbi:MAG: hypothetical protein KGS48_02080 [Bacteroidetes bacterium]|nr:hypothetical protein [Bacteroidota bacterium]